MIRTDRGDSGALDENHGHGTHNFHLGWGELCRRLAVHIFCVFYIFPLVYHLVQLMQMWKYVRDE